MSGEPSPQTSGTVTSATVSELGWWQRSSPRPWPSLVQVDLGSAVEATLAERRAAIDVLADVPVPVIGRGVTGTPLDHPAVQAVGRHLTTSLVTGASHAEHEAWAVTTDDLAASFDEVLATVRNNPQAAAVASQVLRAGADLPITAGLWLESLAYASLQTGEEHRRWCGQRRIRRRPAAVTGATVRLHRDGDRLHVVLDRPERRNALDAAGRQALHDAFAVAHSDPDLTIELSGVGPSFCSGGDLDEFGTVTTPADGHEIRVTAGPAFAITRVADRTTAAIHGPVVGAGVELAAFAGRVVAAPGTTLRLPEVAMGLIPGAGGTASIPRRIGRWRAAWLVLSGTALELERAVAWGLVDAVV